MLWMVLFLDVSIVVCNVIENSIILHVVICTGEGEGGSEGEYISSIRVTSPCTQYWLPKYEWCKTDYSL